MLKDDGVRLDTVVHTDEPTTLAIAELDAGGSARYRFYERATSAPGLTPEAADRKHARRLNARLVAGVVCVLAAWFPAHRASRLAPTVALRE